MSTPTSAGFPISAPMPPAMHPLAILLRNELFCATSGGRGPTPCSCHSFSLATSAASASRSDRALRAVNIARRGPVYVAVRSSDALRPRYLQSRRTHSAARRTRGSAATTHARTILATPPPPRCVSQAHSCATPTPAACESSPARSARAPQLHNIPQRRRTEAARATTRNNATKTPDISLKDVSVSAAALTCAPNEGSYAAMVACNANTLHLNQSPPYLADIQTHKDI